MATLAQWVAGARPRTLPAAVAPVIVGTGAAHPSGAPTSASRCSRSSSRSRLQVGVNYANDYSDGIRGTDDARVGPVRLVGQQLADPDNVKAHGVRVRSAFAGARRPGPGRAQRRVDHAPARARWRSSPPGATPAATTPTATAASARSTSSCSSAWWPPSARCTPRSAGSPASASSAPSGWAPSPRRSSWPTTCATSPPTERRGKRTLAVRLGDRGTRTALCRPGRRGRAAGGGRHRPDVPAGAHRAAGLRARLAAACARPARAPRAATSWPCWQRRALRDRVCRPARRRAGLGRSLG